MARTVSFKALTQAPDQVLLTIYNPNSHIVVAHVRIARSVSRSVHVPASASAEMAFQGSAAKRAVTITASLPVQVQRSTIRNGKAHSDFGMPVPIRSTPPSGR
ncbi:MAG: hypothetical protein DLM70_16575 [Chloroflexi bacterium]|nr:MAG: hypothetical protein DLM70_16575 [Chloroflexota bacterium]